MIELLKYRQLTQVLNLPNTTVIPSQCEHWRGNLKYNLAFEIASSPSAPRNDDYFKEVNK